ncbi:MAG: hypothetical protein PVG07_16675 [Acidobacteriota bacterium]|jgi:hypothetical protein
MSMPDRSVYRSWTEEDLLQAVNAGREEYRREAIEMIEEELDRRGIDGENRADLEQKIRSEREEAMGRWAGVRGWLLIFTLLLALVSLAFIVEGLNLYFSQGGPVLAQWFLWVIGGYGCYVVALLVQRDPSAPRRAFRLVFVFLVPTLGPALLIYPSTSGTFLLLCFSGAMIFGLLEYLRVSRRVAATYGGTSTRGE